MVQDLIEDSAKNLKHWNQSFRVCISDTETIWVQSIATPERVYDGSVIWHGFCYDITDKKNSEKNVPPDPQSRVYSTAGQPLGDAFTRRVKSACPGTVGSGACLAPEGAEANEV